MITIFLNSHHITFTVILLSFPFLLWAATWSSLMYASPWGGSVISGNSPRRVVRDSINLMWALNFQFTSLRFSPIILYYCSQLRVIYSLVLPPRITKHSTNKLSHWDSWNLHLKPFFFLKGPKTFSRTLPRQIDSIYQSEAGNPTEKQQ